MSKSYQPLRPKRTKGAPSWTQHEGAELMVSLHTDDTEFARGYLDKNFSPRFARYAEVRGGRWAVFEIDKSRIRQAVPEQGYLI